MTPQITILDTRVAVPNLGHGVIMEAVDAAVDELFPEHHVYHVAAYERPGRYTLELLKPSEMTFMGGTPVLTSNLSPKKGWRVGLAETLALRGLVMLGVGWKRRQGPTRRRTRWAYHRMLHPQRLHAVRDSYAEHRLRELGFPNVVNTACPTMWGLTPEHCRAIPTAQAPAVIFTLNAHQPDPEGDRRMVQALRELYERVWFFPQQHGDADYLDSLGVEGVDRLRPRLSEYDRLLGGDEPVDYVGMRLHGGIRAMQHRRRTLIVAIDHRAEVMSGETNLPVVSRGDIAQMREWVRGSEPTEIKLPVEAIERWKDQFRRA